MPFAWVYQVLLIIRHLFFDLGIFPSERFSVPVISVGNLSLGGTGKTPHIEHIAYLLEKKYRLAILSRGYKRKTKGFIVANQTMTVADLGDEPQQYFNKFKNITIAVDERRRRGIQRLLLTENPPEIILLDDAFQHRFVKPGLNILLTDFHQLYTNDYLLPVGTLRDSVAAAKRADVIVVTKTPSVFSPFTEKDLIDRIRPRKHQKLFFSFIKYGKMKPVGKVSTQVAFSPSKSIGTILLITGIANPYPLKEYLASKCNDLVHFNFPDHYVFTEKNLKDIADNFNNIIGKNKMIITTEKDATRLTESPYFCEIESMPIYYVPIEIGFHKREGISFEEYLNEYVRKNHTDNKLSSGKN